MTEFRLRDAIIEDLPEILDIYNHEVINTVVTFDLVPHTLEQRKEWFSHYGKGYHPLIVAIDPENSKFGVFYLTKFILTPNIMEKYTLLL
jgi:L-amino acid N-acyltransferase YncA